MDKFGENEPEFSFAKPADTDYYNWWVLEMQYCLESTRLGDHIFSEEKNLKPVVIDLKDKELKDDVKLEYKKRVRKQNYCFEKEQRQM